jgi:glucokinase
MATTAKHIALGLDIGGTRLKAIALDAANHTILHELETDSHAAEGPEKVREAMRAAVSEFKRFGYAPSLVGIGCAGSVDPRSGVVRTSPNFGGWKDIPLKEWSESDFQVPSFVDNDANCAVVAEWKLGQGRGLKNLVLLTLGTGVGGGLVLDDRLYRGRTGTAGELGHLSIYANGERCPCGSRGCLERYCSGSAIRRLAGDVSSKEVFAHPDVPRHAKVISAFIADFSTALTSIVNTFDPDAVLLGGQVSQGVAAYLPEIRKAVSEQAFPAVASGLRIELAKFANLSGSLGAALIALEEGSVNRFKSS